MSSFTLTGVYTLQLYFRRWEIDQAAYCHLDVAPTWAILKAYVTSRLSNCKLNLTCSSSSAVRGVEAEVSVSSMFSRRYLPLWTRAAWVMRSSPVWINSKHTQHFALVLTWVTFLAAVTPSGNKSRGAHRWGPGDFLNAPFWLAVTCHDDGAGGTGVWQLPPVLTVGGVPSQQGRIV